MARSFWTEEFINFLGFTQQPSDANNISMFFIAVSLSAIDQNGLQLLGKELTLLTMMASIQEENDDYTVRLWCR
jgi:hypothetical protein